MDDPKNRPTTWPLAQLHNHPRQRAMFGDLTDAELRDLAEDIKRNGLRQPIEILPDGTIVCGHQRVRAARLLGWTEIEVVVRHDLAGDEAATEQHLIDDNLNRRHLDPLAVARCYQRLKEIERNRPPGKLCYWDHRDLRDRLAQRFGCSGRTLDRHLRILRTPREVQDAFSRGELSLVTAGRVASLPMELQLEIANQIKKGAKPSEIVSKLLTQTNGRPKRANSAFNRLIYHLGRGIEGLDEVADQIRGRADDRTKQLEVLKDTQRLVGQLIMQIGGSNDRGGVIAGHDVRARPP